MGDSNRPLTDGNKIESKDIASIKALLASAGITEYEPRVLDQLSDIAHATTVQLLTGAKNIARQCRKTMIDDKHVRLAAEITGILTENEPNRNVMIRVANEKNHYTLPYIRRIGDIKLPNDRHCLLQPNVEWKNGDDQAETMDVEPATPIMEDPITEPITAHFTESSPMIADLEEGDLK